MSKTPNPQPPKHRPTPPPGPPAVCAECKRLREVLKGIKCITQRVDHDYRPLFNMTAMISAHRIATEALKDER